MKMDRNDKNGAILECDLSVSGDLHDYFDDLNPAPISRRVQSGELSQLQKDCDEYHENGLKTEKLICDLNPKKNYIVHYATLKKYLELGMILDKVHKVVEFEQEPWLESFVNYCTEMRQNAKSDFEKDFWKLVSLIILK